MFSKRALALAALALLSFPWASVQAQPGYYYYGPAYSPIFYRRYYYGYRPFVIVPPPIVVGVGVGVAPVPVVVAPAPVLVTPAPVAPPAVVVPAPAPAPVP